MKKIGLAHYLLRHKWAISTYILFMFISAACDIFVTLGFAQSVTAVSLGEYKNAVFAMLFVGGCILLKRIILTAIDFIYYKYSNLIAAEMNADLTDRVFKISSQAYAQNDSGSFLQRLIYEPDYVILYLTNCISGITSVISSLVIIIYISTFNVYICLIIVFTISVCLLIDYYKNKIYKKNKAKWLKTSDKVTSLTTELIRSERDIKSLNLEPVLYKSATSQFKDFKKQSTKVSTTNLWLHTAKNSINELCGLGLLILGIYFVDVGIITLASYLIIYSNHSNLYSFVWVISQICASITEVKVRSKRMFSLFDENYYPCEHFGDVHLENINGKIEFKNVGFSYVEYEKMKKDDKKAKQNAERKVLSVTKVLQNLSFTIQPNTSVAFVGKSGSGKSTILNLVSKMYEVDEGEVLIDGVNIKSLDKPSLRGAISLVNQFPYIFDMTIKENLLLVKKDATDEEIAQALDKASLTEFVESLDKGVDTKVGESGVKLSGGQKQRLAIARAMLRNSPITIFDESTSSLDNFAQGDIKHSIDEMKGKSTIIIVAHRLSTIKDVDKIFFLEDGQIIDTGTFDELFENNVKFKNMFYAENLN